MGERLGDGDCAVGQGDDDQRGRGTALEEQYFAVRMMWTIRVWVSKDSTNQPVGNRAWVFQAWNTRITVAKVA
jgi:hypothetical protein